MAVQTKNYTAYEVKHETCRERQEVLIKHRDFKAPENSTQLRKTLPP